MVAAPSALAFVYHHALGALLIDSHRHEEAIRLLLTRVRDITMGSIAQIWKEPELIGWPTSLGSNFMAAWSFLEGLPQSQQWLMHFFTDDASFLRALRAYNLTASLIELGTRISEGIAPEKMAR